MTEDEVRRIVHEELAKAKGGVSNLQAEAVEKSRLAGDCACWRGRLCDYHNRIYHGPKA